MPAIIAGVDPRAHDPFVESGATSVPLVVVADAAVVAARSATSAARPTNNRDLRLFTRPPFALRKQNASRKISP